MEEDKEAMAGSERHQQWKERQGGFRATIYMFVLNGFENMGFIANAASMVLYFIYVMHFDISSSANTLTNFMGATFLLSLIGGFISDTYLSRLNTCLIFGAVEVVALMLFTIQAHYPKLQPEPCLNPPCIKGGQAFMFYASLCLLALGAGGVRGSLPSLGGDQFNQDDPKEKKSLASYFNWLLLSTTLGATFGVTFIVYLAQVKGWALGFFLCMSSTLVGFVFLAIGKRYYRVQQPGDSPILQVIQVLVISFRNRKLSLPEDSNELFEVNDKAAFYYEKISHTQQFRCLDKAAILDEDTVPEEWKVCTVTQVEEVKILARMFPIIASTIIMNTCLAQLQTFSVQQGSKMNLTLHKFLVPAASIPVIPLVFMSILIPIYEFLFVPFARKITHHPSGITQLQRVGVGLVLSAVSMAIAGFVEVKRRNQALKDPKHAISLFWLSLQYGIFGIADMFTLVGLLEFFYKEAPSGMRSLSTSFTFLSLSMGYFLSSIFVAIINSITGMFTASKRGWLEGQSLNDIHLDLFYWFLAVLSCLNFVNYLFWSSWYKYKSDETNSEIKIKVIDEKSSFNKEQEETTDASETKEHNASFPDQIEVANVEPAEVLEAKTINAAFPDNKEGTKDKEEHSENQ